MSATSQEAALMAVDKAVMGAAFAEGSRIGKMVEEFWEPALQQIRNDGLDPDVDPAVRAKNNQFLVNLKMQAEKVASGSLAEPRRKLRDMGVIPVRATEKAALRAVESVSPLDLLNGTG